MSRIIPLTHSSNNGKLKHVSRSNLDDDNLSILSNSQSKISRVSAFYSLSTSQRLNQPKPKLKISVSRSSTLNSNTHKCINQEQTSPTKTAIQFMPTKTDFSFQPKSIQYSTIKPLFNWDKLAFLCGGGDELGEQGCLCGDVCPWRQAWVRDRERLDFRVFQRLLEEPAGRLHLGQIEKDLPRTHPECPTFSKNSEFRQMLRKVLVAYSVYDLQMGYVQGVNMIAGVLLYHIKN